MKVPRPSAVGRRSRRRLFGDQTEVAVRLTSFVNNLGTDSHVLMNSTSQGASRVRVPSSPTGSFSRRFRDSSLLRPHLASGWKVSPCHLLAEQAFGAALRYRAYAPVLDRLLQEVGLAEHGMMGILGSVAPGVAVQTGGAVQVNAGATGGHAGGGGQVGGHWDRRRR